MWVKTTCILIKTRSFSLFVASEGFSISINLLLIFKINFKQLEAIFSTNRKQIISLVKIRFSFHFISLLNQNRNRNTQKFNRCENCLQKQVIQKHLFRNMSQFLLSVPLKTHVINGFTLANLCFVIMNSWYRFHVLTHFTKVTKLIIERCCVLTVHAFLHLFYDDKICIYMVAC